jgi:hypothetical protein
MKLWISPLLLNREISPDILWIGRVIGREMMISW